MVAMKTLAGGFSVAAQPEVMVQAVKRGTFVSRVGTVHVDPSKKSHPRAQKRELPKDVAQAMVDKGLVKIVRGRVADAPEPDRGGTPQGEAATQRRQDAMVDEEEAPFVNSGGDTRDTTAFATKPLENQGSRAIAAAAAGGTAPDAVGTAAFDQGGADATYTLDNVDGDIDGGEGDANGEDAPPLDDDGDDAAADKPAPAKRGRKPKAQ